MRTWISIIINNYNYGSFLREAIESALRQTYPHTEVVVVDDGSTDHSREIVAEYAGRIIPILKENGGQASACNAGFAASRGDVVIFLDADDALLPTAAETAATLFDDLDVVKVHWSLTVVDGAGQLMGTTIPAEIPPNGLPDGDLREVMFRNGPDGYGRSPPTSGNAWSRRFLQEVLPIPEGVFRHGVDTHLYKLAPFYGLVRAVQTPAGLYRQHGQNYFASTPFYAYLRSNLKRYEYTAEMALQYCRARGIEVEISTWKARSWWPRLDTAVAEVEALVPLGGRFILVDDACWGWGGWKADDSPACHPIPFLERDGRYNGWPSEDAVAIRELERLRRGAGASHIVFAWPAFWWLDYYISFRRYLESNYHRAMYNDRLAAFDLRQRT